MDDSKSVSSWARIKDNQGNEYFYDEVTGHSQWEPPADEPEPTKEISVTQYSSFNDMSVLTMNDAAAHASKSEEREGRSEARDGNTAGARTGVVRQTSRESSAVWQETVDNDSGRYCHIP
jgi:hypothetical protein